MNSSTTTSAPTEPTTPHPELTAPPPAADTPPTPGSPKRVRIAFTGRLKAGKDFCATAVNAKIHGFADPMYALCRSFFGSADKDLPGVRESLQVIGQWGRNVVDDKYPLTPLRGILSLFVRSHGELLAPGFQVDWTGFGNNPDIWLDAIFRRMTADPAPLQAITNVRFKNEFLRCQAEGVRLFHVMTSPSTYAERLRRAKMPLDHPALTDLSEQLAITMDQRVIDTASREPRGPKLMVVWCDPNLAPPSSRFLTVPEFQAHVGQLCA